MKRAGLAALVVLLLAAGRSTVGATVCGVFEERCCPPGVVDPSNPAIVCDPAATNPALSCSPGGECLAADGTVGCDQDAQCTSGFCQFSEGPKTVGTCVQRRPTPAASTSTMMMMGAGLLLAGLWSVRRVARPR